MIPLLVQTLPNWPAKTRGVRLSEWICLQPRTSHACSRESHLKVICNLLNENITWKTPLGAYLSHALLMHSGYQRYPGETFHFNTIGADTDQGSSLQRSVSDRTRARDSGVWSCACVRSSATAFMYAGEVWTDPHTWPCKHVPGLLTGFTLTGFTFVFFRSANITFQLVIFRKECTSQERRVCIFCLEGRHWPLHLLLHLM